MFQDYDPDDLDVRVSELLVATADEADGALDDKAAFPVGTHISTPVVLPNGEVYGTMCAFSFAPVVDASEGDLRRLRYSAELTANRLQAKRDQLALEPLAAKRAI